MRAATIAMGLGLGAFLMTGCGGSAGSANPLPKATGTLDENQSIVLAQGIFESGLMPSNLVQKMSLSTSKLGKAFSTAGADDDPFSAGEHECYHSGTYTVTIISGKSPSASYDTGASKFVFKDKYDKCDNGDGVKQSGTLELTWNWSRVKNKSFSNDWSWTKENFVYEKDATHKATVKSASGNGKYYREFDSENTTTKEKYERHISITSAEVVNGSEKVSLESLTYDKTGKSDYKKETFTKTRKISGAFNGTFNGKKTNGWIVVTTPVTFEKNEKDKVTVGDYHGTCYHAGKLEIKGKAHTITREVKPDHSITIKFDDKVVKKYANCMDRH